MAEDKRQVIRIRPLFRYHYNIPVTWYAYKSGHMSAKFEMNNNIISNDIISMEKQSIRKRNDREKHKTCAERIL